MSCFIGTTMLASLPTALVVDAVEGSVGRWSHPPFLLFGDFSLSTRLLAIAMAVAPINPANASGFSQGCPIWNSPWCWRMIAMIARQNATTYSGNGCAIDFNSRLIYTSSFGVGFRKVLPHSTQAYVERFRLGCSSSHGSVFTRVWAIAFLHFLQVRSNDCSTRLLADMGSPFRCLTRYI